MAVELPQDKVKKYLLQLIRELPPNARLPTEMELTKELSVGRQTVHKVMSRLRMDGLIVRRRRGGSFVAGGTGTFIVEGDHGLSVKKQKFGTVLIVYPNWMSEDFWLKVQFAEQEAARYDYEIKRLKLEPTSDLDIIIDVVKQDASIKSILIIPPDANISDKMLSTLDNIGLPLVIVGSVELSSNAYKNLYVIDQDRGLTGEIAVKLLIQKGHKKFGYIANEPWSFANRQLKRRMQDYLRDNKIPVRNLVLTKKKSSSWSLSQEVAYEMAKQIFPENVTAVMVDSYYGAVAVRRAAFEQGIAIPDDLSIIVLSQRFFSYKYDCPILTSIFSDNTQILGKAMDILIRGKKPRNRCILIPPKIYPGESVAAR